MPGAPDPATGRVRLAPNIPGFDRMDVATALEAALGCDVLLENDVNLAVQGEAWQGAGQGLDNLAFIALGTGIGGGLVVGGELVRGADNAAGELGFLPFGADPFEAESLRTGAYERLVASAGIRARYAALAGGPEIEVPEVFARAAAGDLAAERVVDETARLLARGIAAIAAIANPRLVVLGGSIGSRPELIARVRALLPACMPAPVAVAPSRLGPQAALIGAAAIGLGHLHNALFGADAPEARLSLPPPRLAGATGVSGALDNRLAAALDRDDALALLRGAVGCQSITGNEAGFAGFLAGEMRRRGVEDVRTADFLPGRPNVWGERRGAGGGPRLLFVGHTDTVHVDGWRQHWQGTEREDPFAAPVVDGAVWGRGAGDLKAGIAASLAALGVLDRAGVRLAGDIGFAFVGDEESGQPGTGVSAGVRAYAARIAAGEVARPDFTVYVEPTRLAVYAAQMGFFIAEITVIGRSAYFGVPELGRDALKAAHSVLAALWAHSDAVNARAEHPLVGRGFLLVTGIEGGGFIAVPERCRLSLIRKLLPGESLDAAAQELEAAVRGAVADPEIRIEIAYPAGRDHRIGGTPTETDPALGPVRLLAAAAAEAMPGRGGIEGAPFWSEAPFFTALGVPAVYCAPGDIRNCHTFEEHVELDEYFAGVLAYARFIARYLRVAEQP